MPECHRPPLRHSGPPLVIPAIESMPRTPIRGRNPGLVYGLQMTRKHLHQSAPRFSFLGVPAATGMGDWYESMSRTPIRDRPLQLPLIGHSRHPFVIPTLQFVIPAKAGIQRVGRGDCSAGACPQLRTDRSFAQVARPGAPTILLLSCGPRWAMVIPAIEGMPRTPIRG